MHTFSNFSTDRTFGSYWRSNFWPPPRHLRPEEPEKIGLGEVLHDRRLRNPGGAHSDGGVG